MQALSSTHHVVVGARTRCRGTACAPVHVVAPKQQSASAVELVAAKAERLRPVFAAVDNTTKHNLERVLTAFRDARVGSHMFAGARCRQLFTDSYTHAKLVCTRSTRCRPLALTRVTLCMLCLDSHNTSRLHWLRPRRRRTSRTGRAVRPPRRRASCVSATSVLQRHAHNCVCLVRRAEAGRRASCAGWASVRHLRGGHRPSRPPRGRLPGGAGYNIS